MYASAVAPLHTALHNDYPRPFLLCQRPENWLMATAADYVNNVQPMHACCFICLQVVDQPQTVPAVRDIRNKPKNYIALSTFTRFCCCIIFGKVALMYALKVCVCVCMCECIRVCAYVLSSLQY